MVRLTTPHATCKGPGGFTVVELLVALAVLGVLLGAVSTTLIPAFRLAEEGQMRTMAGFRAGTAMEVISASLRYSRTFNWTDGSSELLVTKGDPASTKVRYYLNSAADPPELCSSDEDGNGVRVLASHVSGFSIAEPDPMGPAQKQWCRVEIAYETQGMASPLKLVTTIYRKKLSGG